MTALLENSGYMILAFIVVLGITITIHEFGHFAMAKLLKIRVLVFSLGFGPRLAGFTHGGTEYRLSPIPLGGYVKMAGEAYDEDRKGTPDEFLSHPKWHRFLVAVAGPFMNILLAVFILAIAFMQGMYTAKYSKEPAIVGPVAANSIAKEAGLQTGDKIVSVNGNAIKTWEDMEIALGTAPKDSLNITVERNRESLRIRFAPPKGNADPVSLGFRPSLKRIRVKGVTQNSPAQKAGLQRGDEILSVSKNGTVLRDSYQILTAISESKGISLDFEVFRPFGQSVNAEQREASGSSGKILHLSIAPVEEKKGQVLVGFEYDPFLSEMEKYGLIGAIGQSIRRNYEISATTFKIIGRIFTGSASVKTISGPIEIARYSGQALSAAKTGSALEFFLFLGFISLQLGVFNLLPIPILDGGVIALLAIEGIMRRDLSFNLKEKIVQVGFVFLILLMGFVIFNDLSKIDFKGLFR